MSKNVRINWNKLVVTNIDSMDGEEIVNEINKQTDIVMTRQNVSNILKSAMTRFFYNVLDNDKTLTPFTAAVEVLRMLYLPNNSFRGGINSFFRLFPSKIRILIENDAKLIYTRTLKMEKEDKILLNVLCVNCYNCKTSKNKGVFCKLGYFKNKKMDDIELYTPYNFDCESYQEMY